MILDEALSGAPLEQVAAVPQDLVYRVFGRELSMGKSMGLMGMVSMVASMAKTPPGKAPPAGSSATDAEGHDAQAR